MKQITEATGAYTLIVHTLILTDEFSEKEKAASLGLKAERIVSEGQAALETAGASS